MTVLPACAGMSPTSSPRRPHPARAPRMRGDEPQPLPLNAGEGWCSPHARG